jgi:hypothetical protein
VHDEIVAYAPKKDYVAEMGRLKAAMEDVKFDLPMLTDGKWSIKSWHQLKKFNDEELKDDQLTR